MLTRRDSLSADVFSFDSKLVKIELLLRLEELFLAQVEVLWRLSILERAGCSFCAPRSM